MSSRNPKGLRAVFQEPGSKTHVYIHVNTYIRRYVYLIYSPYFTILAEGEIPSICPHLVGLTTFGT